MKTFVWKTERAPHQSGLIDAPDSDTAKLLLFDRQITAVTLRKLKTIRLTAQDKHAFLNELQHLVAAQLPLNQALSLIANSHPRLLWLCETTKAQLQTGATLASALKKTQLFSTATYTLIHTGEQTGQLAAILKRIVAQQQYHQQLAYNLKKALFYPSVVLAMTLLVLWTMLYFIVPKFAAMYAQFQASLPWLTQQLLHLSKFLKQQGLCLGMSFLLLTILLFVLYKRYRTPLLAILYQAPLIKPILQDSLLAKLFFLLSTCLNAGLTLSHSLTLAQESLVCKEYQRAIAHCLQALTSGKTFSDSLHPKCFPPLILSWCQLADSTGTLPQTCDRISEHYSNKLKQKTDKTSLLIEPMILLVLGLCIGGLVIALYLPLFQLGLAV